MKFVNFGALALVIIGGINWLLVGAFGVDLVASLFGPMTPAANAIYILVGVAAIYSLIFFKYVAQTPDHIGVNSGA